MTGPVFVDTNVFVYARDASEPAKQSAAEHWVRQLWMEQRGRTSTQVLSEFYTTVTRKLDPGIHADAAWQDVVTLFAWQPQVTDRDLLTRARELERRFRLHWWDSTIVAAAQMQRCTILLSEDLQSGMRFGETMVLNPFTANVAETGAAYAAAPPRPVSRHRRRGRPARVKALDRPAEP
jgi:predicted nucleic acid-binding protein